MGIAKELKNETEYTGFIHWLEDEGYAQKTISNYMLGVRMYVDGGRPITFEGVSEFRQWLKDNGYGDHRILNFAAGAKRYVQYCKGYKEVRPKKALSNDWHKCNYDCFNCIYPDCIRT